MQPSKGTATPRVDLGVAVYETLMGAPSRGFIAGRVMPYFFVALNAGEFPVIPAEALFNLRDTKRGPQGKYNRYGEQFESGRFKTQEHGLEYPVDDRFAAIYGGLFNYQVTIANMVMADILRAQEARVAAKLQNTSNFLHGNVATGWGNAGADPKSDIMDADAALRAKGVDANTLIFAYDTVQDLKKVTKVIDAVRYLFPDVKKTGAVEVRHLEAYFEKPIMVGNALKNAAKKGKTASLTDIWSSSYAMVARVAENADDVSEPCIGRTFYWNEGAREQVIVEEYYSDEARAMIQRVRHDVTEQLLTSWDEDSGAVLSEISKNCGYLLGNISAT
jgi:hypothetical protein